MDLGRALVISVMSCRYESSFITNTASFEGLEIVESTSQITQAANYANNYFMRLTAISTSSPSCTMYEISDTHNACEHHNCSRNCFGYESLLVCVGYFFHGHCAYNATTVRAAMEYQLSLLTSNRSRLPCGNVVSHFLSPE